MADKQTLSPAAALQISYIHPSRPIWPGVTPRWFLKILPFVSIESGVYRINQVKGDFDVVHQSPFNKDLPSTFGDYELKPKEITLASIHTVLRLNNVSGDLYNAPHNQLKEQTRLIVAALREEQEVQILEHPTTGLVNQVDPSMVMNANGKPTPDAMDELISMVWEKPAFFLAHPKAIASFGKECTARGIVTDTVGMFGAPFTTWRGVPIFPSDKVPVTKDGKSHIFLMRVGEEDQGVIGINQVGVPGEIEPGLSMRMNGIDQQGCTNYMFVLYYGIAVLSPSALGMMKCSL